MWRFPKRLKLGVPCEGTITPGYVSEINVTQRYRDANVYGYIVHNSQAMGLAQVSIKREMDKGNVLCANHWSCVPLELPYNAD